jgi:3-dehydroquinate synthase
VAALVRVPSRFGSYEIRFGDERLVGELPDRCWIITDDNVRRHWGHVLPKDAPVRSVPPGEASKGIDEFERCLEWLAQSGADRRSVVVAFGGGVVGDLAGFVAASYMRGVPYIQAPTSLLAQVDSSVGGKVGIDLPQGKNLVGAFYPPQQVLVGQAFLRTLPDRHIRNGLAEVVKYGYIADTELVERMSGRLEERLPEIVRRCIEIKADVVAEDETEQTGRRAILNFGHTVGHALETYTGYESLLHGEAIAVGMAVEARVGERLGVTAPGTAQRLVETLRQLGLPTTSHHLRDVEDLIDLMRRDKKSREGRLAFSLLLHPGACKLIEDVDVRAVEAALLES